MTIQAIIITCPERANMLGQTITRLAATDWNAFPHVQMDLSSDPDRRQRQANNVRQGLRWFSEQCDADFALLLEDDVAFNAHLRWNLERWSPLLRGRLAFGSLYNPNIRSLRVDGDYFIADPEACYGSQAYLLSRDAVKLALDRWDSVTGMQDIKITRILAAGSYSLHYHRPSLIQHVGRESMWGGGFHSANDFDHAWKSTCTLPTDVADVYDREFFAMHVPWRGEYTFMADTLARLLTFDSAIDVGCGNGFVLERLHQLGKRVAGIDGSLAALKALPAEIADTVVLRDLRRPWSARPHDLVICTEVAAKLDADAGDRLVQSLCDAATSSVFFTSAAPGQGGLRHVNEQPPQYWTAKFEQRGFRLDLALTEDLRAELGRGMHTTWWFPRNALLFCRGAP